jgi:hypothetical protein
MKEQVITFLQPIIPSTPMVHMSMYQIQSQPCFVTNLTLISQHLGWKQPIISLVARQPKVIPYPPYPMRYNIVPSLICTYGS